MASIISKSLRVLRHDGSRSLVQRAARYAYNKLDAGALDEPLFDTDVADSTQLNLAFPKIRPTRPEPLTVGWVTVPPRAGSGGHTTLFRMVEAVEAAGHSCVLFLYDRYGGDVRAHERVIRGWWPNLRADVRDATEGIVGVDAAVASSWDSAHLLARRGTDPMRRLYFIQDFEPWFYARGSMYSLAEDSYRFGFRCIALGEMVAGLLRSEVGTTSDVTEFGCDTSVYRILSGRKRNGIVLYAKPDVPRRGFWLARLALARFHERHPDIDIHVYGSVVRDLPFPVIQHGRLTPTELNELYNESLAGLAISFTNITLVAEEMLAAGVWPVLNDSPHSRLVLSNDNAIWAAPTPDKIADALSFAVTRTETNSARQRASASVSQLGWTKAQADVVRIIEDEVYGP